MKQQPQVAHDKTE